MQPEELGEEPLWPLGGDPVVVERWRLLREQRCLVREVRAAFDWVMTALKAAEAASKRPEGRR